MDPRRINKCGDEGEGKGKVKKGVGRRQNGQAREECVGDVNKRIARDMKIISSPERST